MRPHSLLPAESSALSIDTCLAASLRGNMGSVHEDDVRKAAHRIFGKCKVATLPKHPAVVLRPKKVLLQGQVVTDRRLNILLQWGLAG